MVRQTSDDEDDWEDGWNEDSDGVLDQDVDDADPTIPCPYCGCEIHEDSPLPDLRKLSLVRRGTCCQEAVVGAGRSGAGPAGVSALVVRVSRPR